MKILYLITKSEAGGAQTHVAQLCRYFKNNGHQMAVLSYPGGWLQAEAKKIGVEFISNEFFSNSLNPIKIIKAYIKTKKAIKYFQPDLVHCHSSAAGVYGRLVVRNKIRTLYTAHGWGFNVGVSWKQKYMAILVEKFLSRYCEKIICVSQFVKDLALKYKIAPKDKLKVILNGIELLPEKVFGNNVTEVTFVGRLAQPKEPLLLLQAVSQIKTKINVNVVGSGPKHLELEGYIKNNNLINVKMLGELSREKTLEVLRKCDIFVLLSKWEGMPLTILEAMSVGLPVIASNVGGVSEAVGVNNGILIDNTVDDLKEALQRLLNDLDLRLNMGHEGRSKIKTFFSEEKMFKEINDIYKI